MIRRNCITSTALIKFTIMKKYINGVMYITEDRTRSHGTMSLKRNYGRKQSDALHRVDTLINAISKPIERKDNARANAIASMRTLTR